MMVQEGRPGLTRRASGTRRPHVFLDSPFAQLYAQFEQLTLNSFSPPQAIVSRHRLHQLTRFVSQTRASCGRLRFPSPELAEHRLMPHQDRFGFDNEQCLAPPVPPTGPPNEQPPIRVGWVHAVHATPQNHPLLAQEAFSRRSAPRLRLVSAAAPTTTVAGLCLVQHPLFNPA